MGEADSTVGQLLVTHLLYTVKDLFSASQIKTEEETLWVTRSVIGHSSLIHS